MAEASMSGAFIWSVFRCRIISSVLLAIHILLKGRRPVCDTCWDALDNARPAQAVVATADSHSTTLFDEHQLLFFVSTANNAPEL
jgi:hypothetical protein